MHPVICLITRAHDSGADWGPELIDRVTAAARAGVHLIQIRQPHLEGRTLLGLVERSLQAVRGTDTRVLVNDRIDVAMAAGAHGVHLRADSVPAARLRPIVPQGFLLGRSVHSIQEAREAARGEGLDYLIFGTVFTTDSKPGIAVAGPDTLADVCAASPLPVLGVGGMTLHRLGAVARAGAAGFAAIGLFADSRVEALPRLVNQASLAFDTPRSGP